MNERFQLVSTRTLEELQRFLEARQEILFAYLFGSRSEGKETPLSDADLGFYFKEEPPLLQLGELTSRIEILLNYPVDILVLNSFYKKDPALAYEIVARGRLLKGDSTAVLQEYKKRVIQYYLDTAPLREQVMSAFRKRLDSGNFARIPHA